MWAIHFHLSDWMLICKIRNRIFCVLFIDEEICENLCENLTTRENKKFHRLTVRNNWNSITKVFFYKWEGNDKTTFPKETKQFREIILRILFCEALTRLLLLFQSEIFGLIGSRSGSWRRKSSNVLFNVISDETTTTAKVLRTLHDIEKASE